MTMKNLGVFEKIIAGVIRFLLPVLLILTSVWIVLQTAKTWVNIEYRMPGFPADSYGFTLEDRLYWSSVDINYILSDVEIAYFDAFQLENGMPMHNGRELSHMEDVKNLIQLTWRVLGIGWLLMIVGVVVLQQRAGWSGVVEVLASGARATLWLMVILVVGIIAAFGVLFVGFHRILFTGDTWLFAYSDTFIRLYPERFWRDTFILVALVTLILSALFLWVPKRIFKRA
ncbi:MAG: TIGR01906 family membrane protein [Anaerolineales bacterium]|nr:MAG: TIGR01906 family membrane protein [Anaerolineales bacterium]